jgi:integrase/recombinase XerD
MHAMPNKLSTFEPYDVVGIILARWLPWWSSSIVASSHSTEGALPMKTSKTSNPLGTYLKQFQEHLGRQFYRPATIADYDRCLTALNSKMEELDEDTAVNLIAKSDLPSCRAKHNRFMVHSFVKFLVGLGVAKPTPESVPADTERGLLKRAYEEYLRRQRGLSERTIFHSWRIADRFLTFRFGEELGNLLEIKAADITAFLQHATTRKPPLRDKTLSSHLRNFFRYLFKGGKTTTNLSLGIPSVAQRYGAKLPRHLTPEQVKFQQRYVKSHRKVPPTPSHLPCDLSWLPASGGTGGSYC